MLYRLFLAACIGIATGAAPMAGQQAETLNASRALAHLRQTGSSSLAIAVLARQGSVGDPVQLDAFADSLVSIATSYRHGDAISARRLALQATYAFFVSGNAEILARQEETMPNWESRPKPQLYPNAFEALVSIYRGSPDTRGGTLTFIAAFPDKTRALNFFAEVAASQDPSSVTAIQILSMDMGPAGLAILRRLFETDGVVHSVAREHLEALAIVHGWTQ